METINTAPPVRTKHRFKLDTRVEMDRGFYRFYCRFCPKVVWLSVGTIQHLTLARYREEPRIRIVLSLGKCTRQSIRERERRMKGYVIGD